MPEQFDLSRRLVVESLGTMLLVAAVIGSGIMGEQLAGGNEAIALLANTISTGAALIVLILIFGAISGAHFNPVVSLSYALQKKMPWHEFPAYVIAQLAGAMAGTILAHIMFNMPLLMESVHPRTGTGIWTGEIIASFGLLATILGCLYARPEATPYAVGLFIMSAYWFTSSTSFANPAVTIARSLTDTFSGIRINDVPAFIFSQITGALLATGFFVWIYANTEE